MIRDKAKSSPMNLAGDKRVITLLKHKEPFFPRDGGFTVQTDLLKESR